MPFRKPFRAVPIQEGKAHRDRRERREKRALIKRGVTWTAIAVGVGGTIGYLASTGEDGRTRGSELMSRIGSSLEHTTAKTASPVYFAYCDQARAAGVAPIYAGQPGYRPGLDADGDGIACEPYPR